ncbi:CdaR family protein [Aquimarina muelleri]|uniref:CdaR family protein n=1 Tax=Aquimarina muelleri TaxID=279356 RepID=UPI003F68482F
MPSRKKNKFYIKRSNVKTFLFFLLFTSVLWLFKQFSKNYTKEIEVTIQYSGIPKDKIFNEKSDQILKMVLNGNGFRLMNYYWGKPVLKLDIKDAVTDVKDQYYFYIDKESSVLKNKLDFKGRVLSMQKDTLRLKLDHKLQKKIPVVIEQNIEYSVGYGSSKGVSVFPDSITISGPSKIVDTIQSIKTQKIVLEGLNIDYTSSIDIDMDNLPSSIVVSPTKVKSNILVSKFTEGNQKTPIILNNIPEGLEVKIFPKEISVVYRVGLDKYNEISPRDFIVMADYAKKSVESSFLTLELINKSEFVHDVRLQEKQVQFIVLK